MSSSIDSPTDRRSAPREGCLGQQMQWVRPPHPLKPVHGWMKDTSRTGLAFLAEYASMPRLGDQLDVVRSHRLKADPVRVVNLRPLTSRLVAVGCRREGAGGHRPRDVIRVPEQYWAVASREPQPADEVASDGGGIVTERRSSPRWTTNEPIAWHRPGDRRARAGYVVQRSLKGLSIRTSEGDAPDISERIRPDSPTMIARHRFQSAVVRRRESTPDGQCIIHAEILH